MVPHGSRLQSHRHSLELWDKIWFGRDLTRVTLSGPGPASVVHRFAPDLVWTGEQKCCTSDSYDIFARILISLRCQQQSNVLDLLLNGTLTVDMMGWDLSMRKTTSSAANSDSSQRAHTASLPISEKVSPSF